MRKREAIVQWNTMQEGDRFVRYIQEGAVKMLVVEREAEDLPAKKGTMGYAVVDRDSVITGDVLVVRIHDADRNHPHAWVAPFQTGAWHTLGDKHIVEFREMALIPKVLPGDLRDAIRTGINDVGTESLGQLVEAVERQVWDTLTAQ